MKRGCAGGSLRLVLRTGCARYSSFVKHSPLPLNKFAKSEYADYPKSLPWRWTAEMYYADREAQHAKHTSATDSWSFYSPLAKTSVAHLIPSHVESGDLVEVSNFRGDVVFGLVTFSPVGNKFDLLTLDGKMVSANISDISFLLRGPADSLQVSIAGMHWKDLINEGLQVITEFVSTSRKLIPKLIPYVQAAHAHLSVKSKAVAVDFESLVEMVLRFQSSGSSQVQIKGIHRFAIYLAATGKDSHFVRLPGTPLLSISEESIDAVQKVVHSLLPEELELGVNSLRRRLSDPSASLPPLAYLLSRFLKHFVMYADVRLVAPVHNIMSRIFPHTGQDRDGSLVDPMFVQRFLRRAKLSQDSAFINEGGVAWPHSPGAVTNYATDGLDFATELSGRPTRDPQLPLESFETFEQDVFMLEHDLGVSIDMTTDPDRYIVGVHIPAVPTTQVLRRSSNIAMRGKTADFAGLRLPLIPPSVQRQHEFGDRESLCLSVFSKVKPWNFDWEPTTVSVRWNRVEPHFVVDSYFDTNANLDAQTISASGKFSRLQKFFEDRKSRRKQTVVDFERPFVTDPEDLNEQARLLAGEWCAEYAVQKRIKLPFLSRVSLKEYPEINEAPDVNIEIISEVPRPYDLIGANCYTPIARPFDNSLSLLGQQVLMAHTLNMTDMRQPWHLNKSVTEYFRAHVLPRCQAVDGFVERFNRESVLGKLHEELAGTDSFYIFRCTLLESTTPGESLIPVFCHELGIAVRVLVNKEKTLNVGDTILCTEILDLNPVSGVLVLRM